MAKTKTVETNLIASLTLEIPEEMDFETLARILEEERVIDRGRSPEYLRSMGIKVTEAYVGACSESDISPYISPVYAESAHA